MSDKLYFALPGGILGDGLRDYSEQLAALTSFFHRYQSAGSSCTLLCHPQDRQWISAEIFDDVVDLEGDDALFKWVSNHHGLYVVWNGLDRAGNVLAKICGLHRRPLLRLEYGYLPQFGHIQWDFRSVIGGMSVDRLSVEGVTLEQIAGWEAGLGQRQCCREFGDSKWRAAAALQTDLDSSLVIFSKFPTTRDFLAYLSNRSWLSDLAVRAHPRQPGSAELMRDFQPERWLPLDISPLIQLRDFDLVVGVNSSLLTEAAAFGWPVMPFGRMPGSSLGIYPEADKIVDFKDVLDFWSIPETDLLRRKWLWWLANIKQWSVARGPSNDIIERIHQESLAIVD